MVVAGTALVVLLLAVVDLGRVGDHGVIDEVQDAGGDEEAARRDILGLDAGASSSWRGKVSGRPGPQPGVERCDGGGAV